MHRPPTTIRLASLALLVITLSCGALTACGKAPSDSAAGKDDVASLDTGSKDDDKDSDDETTGGAADDVADEERQDAMLEYAQCMRDHGVDMPDPQFDGDGGVSIGISRDAGDGPPTEGDMKAMDEADEACQPIMEDVMGEAEPMSPEEQSEFRDQQLAFAKCMREHGIDMPDPEIEFESGGRTKINAGGTGAPGDGPEFDPESEQFQTAQAACEPELGEDGKGGGPRVAVGGPAGKTTAGGGK